jgi:hypothetical protein
MNWGKIFYFCLRPDINIINDQILNLQVSLESIREERNNKINDYRYLLKLGNREVDGTKYDEIRKRIKKVRYVIYVLNKKHDILIDDIQEHETLRKFIHLQMMTPKLETIKKTLFYELSQYFSKGELIMGVLWKLNESLSISLLSQRIKKIEETSVRTFNSLQDFIIHLCSICEYYVGEFEDGKEEKKKKCNNCLLRKGMVTEDIKWILRSRRKLFIRY